MNRNGMARRPSLEFKEDTKAIDSLNSISPLLRVSIF